VEDMSRIAAPTTSLGEHIDWALLRPKMAAGMGALSEAVYGNTQLPVREREAARYTIAMINDCAVCRDTRAKDGAAVGADEPFYAEATNWRASTELSERERAAAEFGERFALDHLAMDDEFWDRLHALFSEDELADLVICCGMFLGMGRALAVVGVRAPDQRILV
jgi:alkylhydroperoxidase family enzyme